MNDIRNTPHLFVIGCIVDQQVDAKRAWTIPARLGEVAGGFAFHRMHRLTKKQIHRAIRRRPALHRFPGRIAGFVKSALERIRTEYQGDASRIWRNRPSSALVVLRFLDLDGVGPKIATMAANILVRHFRVRFSDYHSIDISADIHVRRVFRRLGLVPDNASTEQYIYRARSMYPAYPGLLDRPVYLLGKNICRPRRPKCPDCLLRRVCPYPLQRR